MQTLTRFTETLAPHGDFEKIQEINAIIDNIIKSLSIQQGSYIGDPEVGSKLFMYEFEILDEITIEDIKNEIERVINNIDKVTLEDIEFAITSDNKGVVVKLKLELLGKVSKIVTIIVTKEYVNLLSIEENYE